MVDRTRAALEATGRPASQLRFSFVYVAEAHPSDGWRFENNEEFVQHRSVAERLAALERLRELVPGLAKHRVLADNMANSLAAGFGLRNAGIVVIEDERCYLENRTDTPDGFQPGRLEKWLSKRLFGKKK